MSRGKAIPSLLGMGLTGVLSRRAKRAVLNSMPSEPIPANGSCAMLVFMLHHVMVERKQ